MKLFFRVFLLIQLVTLPLRAQYMVQGVVTDSLTKEPLPYTSVYLKGTTEGGMTDITAFFLQDLSPGGHAGHFGRGI